MRTPSHNGSPLQWWIRLCQLLWQPLKAIWIIIVLAAAVSAFATWLFTPLGTDFTGYPIGWVIKNTLLLLLGGTCLLLLTGLVGIVNYLSQNPTRQVISTKQSRENREPFLTKLHALYTENQHLQVAAMMPLRLRQSFDMTYHPSRTILRHSAQEDYLLPVGTTISQVYEKAGDGLLILGGPGTGKSTLLVDLALFLIDRARRDPTSPIPVIVNLASWATKQQPLHIWLVEELVLRYQAPSSSSEIWIGTGQILPLLDGLDEVEDAIRDRCIDAINDYRQKHQERIVPLVVCSRSNAYQPQKGRLGLQSAVEVQPLTSQQVKEYLSNAGKPMAAVRRVLDKNRVLQELITTPLMLNVVMLTYRNKGAKDLPRPGSAEEQQQQIFASYVEDRLKQHDMLKEHAATVSYSGQHIVHWLAQLAEQMKQRSQSEFYLERMQPDWLPTTHMRRMYQLINVLVLLLTLGLPTGIALGLFSGLPAGLSFSLVIGLPGALIFGLAVEIHSLKTFFRSRKKTARNGIQRLLFWLLEWFISQFSAKIELVEIVIWSPGKIIRGAVKGLLGGMLAGLCIGLLITLIAGVKTGELFRLHFWLYFVLLFGRYSWWSVELALGLFGG
ncbi:MAG: NACHT domain-containing protein, partial [Chloroflexota bacterium]|nr:NACHT domain-containing protein [Chloroflexota bacterium]